MARWLVKSEPDVFSIDDLKERKVEPWDGVRNYQARNYLRTMAKGDEVFVYHSNCEEPGIVGIAKVAATAYPDPTQFDASSKYFDPASDPADPRWSLVDLRFARKLKRTVSLTELKEHAARDGQGTLGDWALVRKGNRLSVMPVSDAQWDAVLALESARRSGA
jgi:predicted RNA-binding protein with PUA-like domain